MEAPPSLPRLIVIDVVGTLACIWLTVEYNHIKPDLDR